MLVKQETSFIRLVSSREPIRRVEGEALLAARSDANVLIVGDRGPAKAALARFIHEHSDRAAQRFSMVKCDRLPDEVIQTELFGSESEDETQCACQQTPGVLRSVFSGTVFLDEVHALSADNQERLLCFLENEEPVHQVRVIASTSVSLTTRVADGLFLEALYERLRRTIIAAPRTDRTAKAAAPPAPYRPLQYVARGL
jgi:DNA-binding NtrC family response regulator